MVRYLNVKEVLRIHHRVINTFGGTHGVRDLGLLQSAVARPQTGFGEFEAYPSLSSKAAALLESLARNHAFIDGNKRTALTSCRTFLKRNGQILEFDHQDLFEFVLDVAQGKLDFARIVQILEQNLTGR